MATEHGQCLSLWEIGAWYSFESLSILWVSNMWSLSMLTWFELYFFEQIFAFIWAYSYCFCLFLYLLQVFSDKYLSCLLRFLYLTFQSTFSMIFCFVSEQNQYKNPSNASCWKCPPVEEVCIFIKIVAPEFFMSYVCLNYFTFRYLNFFYRFCQSWRLITQTCIQGNA